LKAAEEEVERIAVAPLANVARAGRDGYREILAGLRLVLGDGEARRLLADFAASTETREHVSPRVALADLLCLGAIRRDKTFRVGVELDEGARRLVLRSRGHETPREHAGVSLDGLEDALRSSAWEFLWDHSGVSSEVLFPLAGGRSLRLVLPAGKRALTTLDWLARERPRHVVSALAPLLGPDR
jgi:hypothetical protein